MIGGDLQIESAESRPLIISWLSRLIFLLSFVMLLAASMSLFASVRQSMQTMDVSAIKPAGSFYKVMSFKKANEAASEAKRISASVSTLRNSEKISGKKSDR